MVPEAGSRHDGHGIAASACGRLHRRADRRRDRPRQPQDLPRALRSADRDLRGAAASGGGAIGLCGGIGERRGRGNGGGPAVGGGAVPDGCGDGRGLRHLPRQPSRTAVGLPHHARQLLALRRHLSAVRAGVRRRAGAAGDPRPDRRGLVHVQLPGLRPRAAGAGGVAAPVAKAGAGELLALRRHLARDAVHRGAGGGFADGRASSSSPPTRSATGTRRPGPCSTTSSMRRSPSASCPSC